MPTRKQRRRRQKELRHEWEDVYLDAEGREIPPEEAEKLLPEQDGRREPRKEPRKGQARRPTGRGGVRGVQPPSWRRVLKRAALFAPVMYLFIYVLTRDDPRVTQTGVLFQTVLLVLVFLPFSYLMDSLTYRMWKKRQAKTEGR